MPLAADLDGFEPGGRIEGEIRVPSSKSLAQRALVCAGLASGATRLTALTFNADLTATRAALESLGVEIRTLSPRAIRVQGRPPGPNRGLGGLHGLHGNGAVPVGESGTGARLMIAAVAFCAAAGRPICIQPAGTLRGRRSPPLFAALAQAGVRCVHPPAAPAGFALEIFPLGPPSTVRLESPISSQEASALLVALAAFPGEHRLEVSGEIPSRPYLSMTLDVLGDFGVIVEAEGGPDAESFTVRGPLVPPATPIEIEPDASAAAVALAAACLSAGRIHVPGLGASSRQGDVRIVSLLERFGSHAAFETLDGTAGITAGGLPTRAADVDLTGEPDLAPVLAPIAAAAALSSGDKSRLTGLATLEGKESPRLSGLRRGLAALGFAVEASADALTIGPPSGGRIAGGPFTLDAAGDHRMAFAFALLGLLAPGVRVTNPACVAKSWPGFWDDLESVGARRPGAPS